MKNLFLHIPKAGGNTLYSILGRMYPETGIFDIVVDSGDWETPTKQFINLSPVEKNKIVLLRGHMYWGLHKYFDDDYRYFTFLRNPVERIISHYYFVQSIPNHYLNKAINEKKLSLVDYAISDLSWELDNSMTRLFSGIKHNDSGSCTEDAYSKALHNLQTSFAVVGITERYDESLILLKNKLGWVNYPYYKKLNVTKKKNPVSGEIKKRIAERNQYDMKLYRWALKEFDNQIKTVPKLNEELFILKNTNRSYEDGVSFGYDLGHENGIIEGSSLAFNNILKKYPILKFFRSIKKKVF